MAYKFSRSAISTSVRTGRPIIVGSCLAQAASCEENAKGGGDCGPEAGSASGATTGAPRQQQQGGCRLRARLWRAMAAQWEHFYALSAPTLAANIKTKPMRLWDPSSGTFVGVRPCLGSVSRSPLQCPFPIGLRRSAMPERSCRGFGTVSVGTSR